MQIQKVLILGAGAIGQVIGTHLRLSGCDVSFWVRPYQKEAFEAKGFTLYNLSSETELHIAAPQLLTEIPEDAQYDALFLCVRSDQLDAALAQVKASFQQAENMILVTLQPGREDALKVFRALPDLVIVPGTPAFSAYIQDQRVEYWAPKSMPSMIGAPFNETLQVRDQIVKLLQRGGIPTKGVNDLEAEVRFPSAALVALLAAFHLADCSFKNLSHNKKLLNLAAQAIQEGVAITKKDLGFIPLKYMPLEHISGAALAKFFWALEHSPMFGFMQNMWGVHARKIETQTYQNLDDLLALSLHQSKNAPPALTALAAMTPAKIGEYLKTTSQFSRKDPKKSLKVGVALGFGGLVLWKLLARKRS
jgi:ketopantoate reductase